MPAENRGKRWDLMHTADACDCHRTPATSLKKDSKTRSGGSGSGGSRPQQTRKRQLVTQSARP